jgi:hypothetical protein
MIRPQQVDKGFLLHQSSLGRLYLKSAGIKSIRHQGKNIKICLKQNYKIWSLVPYFGKGKSYKKKICWNN